MVYPTSIIMFVIRILWSASFKSSLVLLLRQLQRCTKVIVGVRPSRLIHQTLPVHLYAKASVWEGYSHAHTVPGPTFCLNTSEVGSLLLWCKGRLLICPYCTRTDILFEHIRSEQFAPAIKIRQTKTVARVTFTSL